MIQTAQRLKGVEEYYFSQKLKEIARMRAEGHNVLNLGIGSPDFAPDTAVTDTLSAQSRVAGNHGYQSYVGIPELRRAFADWYQRWFSVSLDPDTEILPLMGSKEGILHIAMTYLEAGDQVLVPNPGYPAYRATALLTGASIVEYALTEEKSWFPDLEALARLDLSKVKIMWLNYPHMPTGATATYAQFEQLVAFAQAHKILLCHDNPYGFILNEQPMSLLSVPGAMDVVLELNSLSKSHSMAGWRVGMLAGKADYLRDVLRFKSNMDSGMFRPLQFAAAEALQAPAEWYQNQNALYRARREKVFELLDTLDCVYSTDQVGLFVWARIPGRYADGFALSDKVLYGADVFITPGGIFGSRGNGYVRVSLCSPVEVFEEANRRCLKLTGETVKK
jgi:LL-diaminopimelate aminotransferase